MYLLEAFTFFLPHVCFFLMSVTSKMKGCSGTCPLLTSWRGNSSPRLCLPWPRMCWSLSPAGQTAPPPITSTLMFSTMPLGVCGENCVYCVQFLKFWKLISNGRLPRATVVVSCLSDVINCFFLVISSALPKLNKWLNSLRGKNTSMWR